MLPDRNFSEGYWLFIWCLWICWLHSHSQVSKGSCETKRIPVIPDACYQENVLCGWTRSRCDRGHWLCPHQDYMLWHLSTESSFTPSTFKLSRLKAMPLLLKSWPAGLDRLTHFWKQEDRRQIKGWCSLWHFSERKRLFAWPWNVYFRFI